MAVRLGLAKADRWLDLPHGVRFKVRPLTTAVYYAARQTAVRMVIEYAVAQGVIEDIGGDIDDLPDASNRDALEGMQTLFFAQALAKHAAVEWEGVGGEDDKPAALSIVNIKALMSEQPAICEAFVVKYTAPIVDAIIEGNS